MDRVSLSLSLENKGRGPSPWTSGQVRAPHPDPRLPRPRFSPVRILGTAPDPASPFKPRRGGVPHSRNPKDLPLEPTTMDGTGRDGTGRDWAERSGGWGGGFGEKEERKNKRNTRTVIAIVLSTSIHMLTGPKFPRPPFGCMLTKWRSYSKDSSKEVHVLLSK